MGVWSLARVEFRRWMPLRAAVLMVTSIAILAFVNLVFRGEADTAFGDIFSVALVGWTIVLVMVVVASTQGVLADDVEDGTAAWAVSMPVTRSAYVVGKFLGAAPAVAVAAVFLPGMAAYPLFASTASVRQEISATSIAEALAKEPESYAGMPTLARYVGMLSLFALFTVFLVAMMLLYGSRIVSTTALLGLGLATAGILVALALSGVEIGAPSAALIAVLPGRLDDFAIGPAAVASAAWSLVAVGLAAWSFERRPL